MAGPGPRRLTVEHRVRDHAARVVDLHIAILVAYLVKRLAVVGQRRIARLLAEELVEADALDIPAVVLVEVRELVIQHHGRLDLGGHVEAEPALQHRPVRHAVRTRAVIEGVLWRVDLLVRVQHAQLVDVGRGREVGEVDGRALILRRGELAVAVVDVNLVDLGMGKQKRIRH